MGFGDLFKLKNWFTIDFNDAKPELAFTLLRYLGKFPVVRGDTPCTDGHQIMLQASIDDFEDPKEVLYKNRNVSMYVATLCHEISHIVGGAFLVDFTEYIDEHFEESGLAGHLHNIIRDRVDEDNFKERFASRNDIELMEESNKYYVMKKRKWPSEKTEAETRASRFMELYSMKVIAGAHKGDLLPEMRQEVEQFLTQPVLDESLHDEGIHTLDDLLNRMVKVSMVDDPDRVVVARECLEATEEVYRLSIEELKNLPKDKGGYKRGGKHGKGKVKIRKKKDLDDKEGEIREAAKRSEEEIEQSKKEALEEKKERERSSEFEFDYKRKAYSRRAKVYDRTVTEQNWAFVDSLAKYRAITDEIVCHLLELKPNQLQLVQYTDEPDEYNMEAVLEVLADPALRHDSRVYDSVDINRRDYAVGILVDSSGSTSHQINGETVLDIEKALAGILYQSLTAIQDNVSMYTWESDYQCTTDTRVHALPGLENLGAINPTNANRDGVAIRRVTKHLLDEDAVDRWLIVVADGKPNAHEYEGEYAVKDTAKAIAEAEEKGVRVIYLNVDSEQPDYFAELTGNASYARWFNSVKELPKFSYELVTEVMV